MTVKKHKTFFYICLVVNYLLTYCAGARSVRLWMAVQMSLRRREAVDAGKPRVPTTSTVRVRWSPANCSRPTIHRTTHPTPPVSTTSTQSPTSEYGSRSTRFSYSLPIPGNGRVSITLSITTSSQPLCWQMSAVSTTHSSLKTWNGQLSKF